MDQAVVHFQKAAARENRDRGSVRRRYSSTRQQQAVEYCRERQRHQVQVARPALRSAGAAPVVIMTCISSACRLRGNRPTWDG